MQHRDPIEILLVEDDPDDVELAISALGEHGSMNYVRVCRDGEEALAVLFTAAEKERARPRIILLDLKLPRVDGIQVLEHLKANDLTRHIPVVMLTASKEEKDVEACYRRGVNSYVVKPVDFDQFRAVMGRIVTYWLRLNTPAW